MNADCVAATASHERWKCFMAQYTLAHVKSPMFIQVKIGYHSKCICYFFFLLQNSRIDNWQLRNVLSLKVLLFKPSVLNATVHLIRRLNLVTYRAVPAQKIQAWQVLWNDLILAFIALLPACVGNRTKCSSAQLINITTYGL